MKETNQALLGRRDILRGAAVVTASVAMGLAPDNTGKAEAATSQAASATTLAYWTGNSFIDPSTITATNPQLYVKGANVTIQGHFLPSTSTGPVLRVLVARFAVLISGAIQYLPFYTWAALPSPTPNAQFHMPVAPAQGLVFSIRYSSTVMGEEYYFLSYQSTPGTPTLHVGTYVLAAGSPNWAGCRLVTTDGVPAVQCAGSPVNFEYLTIAVG
jgi:hypothetical protein